MKRMHLVEFEDLPWVPAVMRDGARDVLDVLFARVHFYRPLAPKLMALITATGEARLLDLCSGSGGGALAMHRLFEEAGRRDVAVELTDLYPNDAVRDRVSRLAHPQLHYRREPLDARHAPGELPGIRTLFSSLHHFQPLQIQELLGSAVAARAPIAVFDVAASPVLRQLPAVLTPLVAVPNLVLQFLMCLLLTPLVRPVRLSRLAWTYLLPAIPLLYAWDATVSALRAYAPDEVLALAQTVPGAGGYVWESGRLGKALFLTGRPR